MIEDYSQPTWTPEGSSVTFHFSKRKVIAAWELMDKFRETGIQNDMPLETMNDYIPIMLSATHEQMKELRNELFLTVKWAANGDTPKPLLGNEDAAFADLSPDDVYSVMLRSVTVNFMTGTPTTGHTGKDQKGSSDAVEGGQA